VIANKVLIAQMFSLDSWASYFKEATNTSKSLFKVLKNIRYFQCSAIPIGAGTLVYRANHANGIRTGVKELYEIGRNPGNGIPIVDASSCVVSVARVFFSCSATNALHQMQSALQPTD
jgi:hypothetical protein